MKETEKDIEYYNDVVLAVGTEADDLKHLNNFRVIIPCIKEDGTEVFPIGEGKLRYDKQTATLYIDLIIHKLWGGEFTKDVDYGEFFPQFKVDKERYPILKLIASIPQLKKYRATETKLSEIQSCQNN